MPMLGDATQALKRGIGTRPSAECWLEGSDYIVQCWEVLIVETATPDQFPDAFDRIELWTVRRQKMEPEVMGDGCSPRLVQHSVVIACVIADDHHCATRVATDAFQFTQEVPASLRIEPAFRTRHYQLAVPQAHCPEETDAFACRSVSANRIVDLGRNPETTARSVLLKVYFIHGPHFHLVALSQTTEFFYARLEVGDPLVRPVAWVCANENRAGETAVGIAAPLASRRVRGAETPRELDRPTSASVNQIPSDWRAVPILLSPVRFHSSDSAARNVPLPIDRPDLALRSAAPSSRPCVAHRRAVRRLADKSFLAPPAKPRASDDRNATCRCGESRPAVP